METGLYVSQKRPIKYYVSIDKEKIIFIPLLITKFLKGHVSENRNYYYKHYKSMLIFEEFLALFLKEYILFLKGNEINVYEFSDGRFIFIYPSDMSRTHYTKVTKNNWFKYNSLNLRLEYGSLFNDYVLICKIGFYIMEDDSISAYIKKIQFRYGS